MTTAMEIAGLLTGANPAKLATSFVCEYVCVATDRPSAPFPVFPAGAIAVQRRVLCPSPSTTMPCIIDAHLRARQLISEITRCAPSGSGLPAADWIRPERHPASAAGHPSSHPQPRQQHVRRHVHAAIRHRAHHRSPAAPASRQPPVRWQSKGCWSLPTSSAPAADRASRSAAQCRTGRRNPKPRFR